MSSSAHSIRGAVKTPVLDANAKIRFPKPGRTSTAVDANQLTLGADAKNAVKGADDAAFATLADARNAADRRNAMSQPVVGAQEGLAEALALKIGDRIIAAITKTLSSLMEELRMADKPAPAPATTESAGLADSSIRKLCLDDEPSKDGTAATAGDSSGATAATAQSSNTAARRNKSKTTKARGRSSSRRPSDEQSTEANPCKHCRKHGRHLRHPKVPSSQCFWNTKYKGFRPLYICQKLKRRFKPRADFPAALGGYPSDSDAATTSDEE